jgi:hypothetical protein
VKKTGGLKSAAATADDDNNDKKSLVLSDADNTELVYGTNNNDHHA